MENINERSAALRENKHDTGLFVFIVNSYILQVNLVEWNVVEWCSTAEAGAHQSWKNAGKRVNPLPAIHLGCPATHIINVDPYIYNVRGTTHIINVDPYIINVRGNTHIINLVPYIYNVRAASYIINVELTFIMLLRLHVKCNPYIYNVRDDIKDAASQP